MIEKNKIVNGILLVDKPLDISSNGLLQRVKRLFGAKKAGHTGSLDPLATGMLPICFGEATKFSQYLLDANKYYDVVAKLGEKTLTGDAEGDVIETRSAAHVTEELIQQVIKKFVGVIKQIPPMFSALKYQGKPLYELARKGLEVERKAREIEIYQLQYKEKLLNTFKLSVHCSKGTYIRTLIEDIGEALGCGAHVIELRRTAVSPYEKLTMVTLQMLEDRLQQQGQDALQQLLLPIDTAIQHFPAVKLSATLLSSIKNGIAVVVPGLSHAGCVRIFSEDNVFVGLGEVKEGNQIAPRRLVASNL
jgi:tRNA pseudouridine55 synthase